jgi:hypothetical protein
MARTKGRGARIRTPSPTPSSSLCNPPSPHETPNIVDNSPNSTQNPNTNQNPQTEPEDIEPISVRFPPFYNPETSENDPSEEVDVQLTQKQPINVEGMTTPNPTIVVPSQAETPPIIVKTKKSNQIPN